MATHSGIYFSVKTIDALLLLSPRILVIHEYRFGLCVYGASANFLHSNP
jgi:hypothetical protein